MCVSTYLTAESTSITEFDIMAGVLAVKTVPELRIKVPKLRKDTMTSFPYHGFSLTLHYKFNPIPIYGRQYRHIQG